VARARRDWVSARPVLLQLGKLPLCARQRFVSLADDKH
jgi:hypothetical protein